MLQTARHQITSFGAVILLVGAAVGFCFEVRSILQVDGWWIDELFSLWTSDPELPLRQLLYERIFDDTNPPLYYLLLSLTRKLIHYDWAAVLTLNLTILAGVSLAILLCFRRSNLFGWSAIAISTFILSGPVVRYLAEARPYLPALAVVFAASWFCNVEIQATKRVFHPAIHALIGVAAALIHFYAALACVCWAAVLILFSLRERRPHLRSAGLALGLSAALVALIWLPWALQFADRLGPSELSYSALLSAYWDIRQLAFGSRSSLLLFILVLACALVSRPTRRAAMALIVASGLFALIPLLVSLVQPVIVGRYSLIGTPFVVVFVVFTARSYLAGAYSTPLFAWGGAAACAAFLVTSEIGGYAGAWYFTSIKQKWQFADYAAPLLRQCPTSSVHVSGGEFLFATAAHVPESVFVDVVDDEPLSVSSDNRPVPCPILGWAEHLPLDADFSNNATDAELLQMLKIDVPANDLTIYRHPSGAIVVRKGTSPPTEAKNPF